MEENNNFIDAKSMYTKQLISLIFQPIYEGFMSLYEEAKAFKEDTKDPGYDDYSEIQVFQDYLRKIPKWNQDIIDSETKRIVQKTRYSVEEYELLLEAVFVSNYKILSSVRIKNPKTNKINLDIPKLERFIHTCYKESSREIYQNALLFDNEDVTSIEKQRNTREVVKIIKEGIEEAIRKLLPMDKIITAYMGKVKDTEITETTENTIVEGEERDFEKKLFQDFTRDTLMMNTNDQESTSGSEEETTAVSNVEKPEAVVPEEESESDESEEVNIVNPEEHVSESTPSVLDQMLAVPVEEQSGGEVIQNLEDVPQRNVEENMQADNILPADNNLQAEENLTVEESVPETHFQPVQTEIVKDIMEKKFRSIESTETSATTQENEKRIRVEGRMMRHKERRRMEEEMRRRAEEKRMKQMEELERKLKETQRTQQSQRGSSDSDSHENTVNNIAQEAFGSDSYRKPFRFYDDAETYHEETTEL